MTAPTYISLLVERLAAAGERPVLRHDGRDTSGAALRAAIFRHARALAELGIGRGTLVALFAPNRPDALAIRYAANLLGAGAAYLSVPPAAEDRAALLAQMAPDLLVLFPETAALLPAGTAVRVAMAGDAAGLACPRLDLLARAASDQPLACAARPDDLAVIVSSGGTTGVPKGSWRTFATYTAMVTAPSPGDRRQLLNGRLAYLSQVLADITLLGGGLVVLADAYDPAETLAAIEAERITDLFLVEPQLFELMDHPDVARRDLASLRTLTHIGASAPPTLRRRARERLGPVLLHTYGASEMGIVSALLPAEHDPARPDRFGCAGRIRAGVELRLRRADGTLADPGEPGGIEVRSPAMAQGYRHRPEQQATAFQDGWYHTGDLGRVDPEGWLYILGRTADIAWIDGVMVSPTLVEDTLCRLPDVRYAVVAVDHATDTWIATVVPWPGMTVDRPRCRDAIAAAHGVAAVVLPLDRVPLTEQGKPDRAAICRLGRAAAQSVIA